MAMSSVGTLILLLLSCYQTTARPEEKDDDVTDCTDLLFAFMVHRHGDRTPVQLVLNAVKGAAADNLDKYIAPYGYGQLTNAGKRRAYKLGQHIRRRYDELLSPTYNVSEIYIRSTDSSRAKMTVLTAMAAVYPAIPGESWSEEINWVPVPYTTVPARYDFNQATVNCPVYITAYNERVQANPNSFDEYEDVLKEVSNIINNDNITMFPALTYFLSDLYASEISLGIDLGPNITDLYPSIEGAADKAIELLYGDEDYINLQAGVMLKQFFDAAFAIAAGNTTQKVRVYSAHDFNVYSFEAVTKVPRQGVPQYVALYSLELRRDRNTGEYVVLPVYLPSPGEEVVYLQVEGCGELLCNLDKFFELTSKYIIEDEKTYREECGLTEDTELDTSSTD